MAGTWTDVESNALLKIWGTKRVQGLLTKATRNKPLEPLKTRLFLTDVAVDPSFPSQFHLALSSPLVTVFSTM